MQEYKTDESAAGQRADVFVAGRYPQFARSSLKALFERGEVLVNGKLAKPGYKLHANDTLVVDTSYLVSQPETVELPVLYEDDNVIVINKPAGVLTHSKGALNLEPTVASFIAGKITDKQLSGSRAGIVHRLDRPTSGVIICAKTRPALAWLQRQFAARKTEKTYLAIVEGQPQPAEALIDVPIGRNPKRPQTFKAMPSGKPAQTRLKNQETFSRDGRQFTSVELRPLTGRTHQLRVHLAYIGHPVAGDAVYGHKSGWPLMLHAQKLSVVLPGGEKKTFSAPLPETFKDFAES